MDAEFASIRWLTGPVYHFFRFSDHMMVWVVVLAAAILILYSAVCVF